MSVATLIAVWTVVLMTIPLGLYLICDVVIGFYYEHKYGEEGARQIKMKKDKEREKWRERRKNQK